MNSITIPEEGFKAFPKIKRANKSFQCIMTEKLDGTNAQIVIRDNQIIGVGSRSRWITPGKSTDNYGFAEWIEQNYESLLKLGEGTHFGEWWGQGIQRNYGLNRKVFSLFNTSRWTDETLPECCSVVPVIYQGDFSREILETQMNNLWDSGSYAAPGFMNPEGLIVYLCGVDVMFKETFEFSEGKWKEAEVQNV